MEKVYSCRIKNWHDMRHAFYLIFSFLRFKVVDKRTMNLFKDSEDFGFYLVEQRSINQLLLGIIHMV